LTRAGILLKSDCSEGGPNWTSKAICDALDTNSVTVTAVRKAYAEGGLEKALNRKKPDREYGHCLDGKAEAHLMHWPARKLRWIRAVDAKVIAGSFFEIGNRGERFA